MNAAGSALRKPSRKYLSLPCLLSKDGGIREWDFFFLLRLHSFFPFLHIGTKENGGEGRYSHAMEGNCLYVCILREGKIFSGVCNSPGYPSFDPCYSDHSDTDRYGIPPLPFFGLSLGVGSPFGLHTIHERKKAFLIGKLKGGGSFSIPNSCLCSATLSMEFDIDLASVAYIYIANTRNC